MHPCFQVFVLFNSWLYLVLCNLNDATYFAVHLQIVDGNFLSAKVSFVLELLFHHRNDPFSQLIEICFHCILRWLCSLECHLFGDDHSSDALRHWPDSRVKICEQFIDFALLIVFEEFVCGLLIPRAYMHHLNLS